MLSEGQISRLHGLDVEHVDGKMNALERARLLDWLRASEEDAPNECRILSNARCLSEGVEVPALDAVLFLYPRKSIVDVVQSVGRVMRRAPNKRFGYIILPVVIPPGKDAESALDNNLTYAVVWQVLQALRSHDERLDAEINQIDLNQAESGRILNIGIGKGGEGTTRNIDDLSQIQQFTLPGFVVDAFHAKVLDKVGDRQYWDRWAKDVATIATTLEERIRTLIPKNGATNSAAVAGVGLKFDSLLDAMRKTTNDALSEDDAIGIVAEHMITEPVFSALFSDYDFAKSNPVARSLNQFVSLLSKHGLDAELNKLADFYASVRRRAEGMDNSAGRRKVLEELYENFFKYARPKVAQRLGVVYTPHEIVDFILNSADYLLRKEFGKSLSDEGVHILDPFTGMGTFIHRLLSNPELIRDEDLERKYLEELHANEILPLAYYMATVNVEETFIERMTARDGENPGYLPFEGIVYRDTFNAKTQAAGQQATLQFMAENDERARKQDQTGLSVIVSNPPYSAWQKSANDDNPNIQYPHMHQRIRQTYGSRSRAQSRPSHYDHYKLAIRWATDRMSDHMGVIGLVTNGSFIDSNADSGVRACIEEEFNSIYTFNLRGNQRTQGKTSRREGGKIFGSGSRAPIAITMFVKNSNSKHEGCQILYKDIGEYLTREQKLSIIANSISVKSIKDWQTISPDKDNDWINLNDPTFDESRPIGTKYTKSGKDRRSLFGMYSRGIITSRDDWLYGFSSTDVNSKMTIFHETYESKRALASEDATEIDDITIAEPTRIKWDATLKNRFKQGQFTTFNSSNICANSYRPFIRKWLYLDSFYFSSVYRVPSFFPTSQSENITIHLPGPGSSKRFSSIVSDALPDLHLIEGGQTFPKFTYDENPGSVGADSNETNVLTESNTQRHRTHARTSQSQLPGSEATNRSQHSSPISSRTSSSSPKAKSSRVTPTRRSQMERCSCGNAMPCGVVVELDGKRYVRHDNILDEALDAYVAHYADDSISKDDIFYYVYGLLHSPLYRERYQNNLRRELPRIPMAPDFWASAVPGAHCPICISTTKRAKSIRCPKSAISRATRSRHTTSLARKR